MKIEELRKRAREGEYALELPIGESIESVGAVPFRRPWTDFHYNRSSDEHYTIWIPGLIYNWDLEVLADSIQKLAVQLAHWPEDTKVVVEGSRGHMYITFMAMVKIIDGDGDEHGTSSSKQEGIRGEDEDEPSFELFFYDCPLCREKKKRLVVGVGTCELCGREYGTEIEI